MCNKLKMSARCRCCVADPLRQRDMMGGEAGRQSTGDGAQGGSASSAGSSATVEATTRRQSTAAVGGEGEL